MSHVGSGTAAAVQRASSQMQGSVSLVSVCDAVMCEAISGRPYHSARTRGILDAPAIISHWQPRLVILT